MTTEKKAHSLGLTIVSELNSLNPVILVFKGEKCVYGSIRNELIESFLDSYDASHDYAAPSKSSRKPRRA
jgi:hypothetical protein